MTNARNTWRSGTSEHIEWKTCGNADTNLAKVRVVGSNPIARSKIMQSLNRCEPGETRVSRFGSCGEAAGEARLSWTVWCFATGMRNLIPRTTMSLRGQIRWSLHEPVPAGDGDRAKHALGHKGVGRGELFRSGSALRGE